MPEATKAQLRAMGIRTVMVTGDNPITAAAIGAEAGVDDRVRFEVASAQEFGGRGSDLVTMFDCLHDMGDPVGAGKHVRESLARDGRARIVAVAAGSASRMLFS